ncbi:hypothetical protein TNCV_4520231 [Trichonephila clavipes]|nr:hypothetical protein TNCV_4520231 [Trichonephila clavipes]
MSASCEEDIPRRVSRICQINRSIDKPSIWCTKYSEIVDLSHDDLLSQLTNGGTWMKDAGRRLATSANQKLLARGGGERGPPGEFKNLVWKAIFFFFENK